MKKVNKFVLVVMLLLPAFAFGQVTEEWVARYDRQGLSDSAKAMTVDMDGNIYVVGQSGNKGVAVKYDTNGNKLWEALYDFSPEHITVGNNGNTYITGYAGDGGEYGGEYGTYDMFTAKLDSQGNLVWVKTFGGIGTGSCMGWYSPLAIGRHIAVDSEGNVVVMGEVSV